MKELLLETEIRFGVLVKLHVCDRAEDISPSVHSTLPLSFMVTFRLEELVSHVCSHPELPTLQSGQTNRSGDTVSILASARTAVFDSRLRICQI